MADLDKVKILILGDSGVGKTSLTHLIAHNEVIRSPSWTVGCSVEVKLHEFREGYPQQRTLFMELWDVGGSSSHRNTRSLFYNPVHGVILVHDLTNKKSQVNLNKWLAEVLNHESGNKARSNDELDAEMLLGGSHLPLLVMGTKLDVAGGRGRGLTFAEEVGADEWSRMLMASTASLAPTQRPVSLRRMPDRQARFGGPPENCWFETDAAGKVASQCSHAAVSCYKTALESDPGLVRMWELQGQPKIVLRASQSGEGSLTSLAAAAAKNGLTSVIIRDAGRTEVIHGSATVLGLGPASSQLVSKLTSSLRLY